MDNASPSSPFSKQQAPKPKNMTNHSPKKPPASKQASKRTRQPLRSTLLLNPNHHHPFQTPHHKPSLSSSPPRRQAQRSSIAKKSPSPALLYQPLSLSTPPAHRHSPIPPQKLRNRSVFHPKHQNTAQYN